MNGAHYLSRPVPGSFARQLQTLVFASFVKYDIVRRLDDRHDILYSLYACY